MNTFVFVTMKAALFLSQTISAIKCCSRWELICFHSKLQLFPEESGVDGQNYVVSQSYSQWLSSDLHLPSQPSKY